MGKKMKVDVIEAPREKETRYKKKKKGGEWRERERRSKKEEKIQVDSKESTKGERKRGRG